MSRPHHTIVWDYSKQSGLWYLKLRQPNPAFKSLEHTSTTYKADNGKHIALPLAELSCHLTVEEGHVGDEAYANLPLPDQESEADTSSMPDKISEASDIDDKEQP